jgi:hypothetical protein
MGARLKQPQQYFLPLDTTINMRVWWAKNRLVALSNDDRVWRQDYIDWLREQGVEADPAGPPQDTGRIFYARTWTSDSRQHTLLVLKYADSQF